MEQAPESDMSVILELFEQEFKITMIKMVRALMYKVDNMPQ